MFVGLNMHTLREYNPPLDSAINARCQGRQKLQRHLQSFIQPTRINRDKLTRKRANESHVSQLCLGLLPKGSANKAFLPPTAPTYPSPKTDLDAKIMLYLVITTP